MNYNGPTPSWVNLHPAGGLCQASRNREIFRGIWVPSRLIDGVLHMSVTDCKQNDYATSNLRDNRWSPLSPFISVPQTYINSKDGEINMSKKDEFKDLRQEMLKLKSERKNPTEQNDEQDSAILGRIKLAIEPVLNAFVDSDRSLDIQSNGLRDVYIAYAHTKICRISISATSLDSTNVSILADSVSSGIYSGEFNQGEIKNAVKNALLNWYRTLL